MNFLVSFQLCHPLNTQRRDMHQDGSEREGEGERVRGERVRGREGESESGREATLT